MQNVHFFTGENAYALAQERRRWSDEFTAKHGPENRIQIDGSAISLRELLDEVSAAPFISAKRLMILRGMPRFTKEEMQVLLQSLHPDCVLLVCDGAPDKRLGGLKHLLTVAMVKEFPRLRGRALLEWMQREAAAQGCTIGNSAAELLLATVGDEQEMLAQEIAKLGLGGAPITEDRVRLLAVPSGEQEIWQLTNILTRGDLPGALHYAQSLLRSGEDPFSLWNILLWVLRSLVAVALCCREGEKNPARIASSAGVPFPTARMLTPMAQSLTLPQLRALLDWAVAADRDLKTGGYRATADATQELVALIDELIVRCCSLQMFAISH